MTDLDYAKVVQRLALNVGDSDDPDEYPDTIWCDEGRIDIVPDDKETYVKVVDGSPVPFTGGNAVISCQVSQANNPDAPNYYAEGSGFLLYRGQPYVWIVDLTSDKVNPRITDGATHQVKYIGVRADGTDVPFPSIKVRITAAGDGVSPDGVNDLTVLAPANPGSSTPITVGPRGRGVASSSITPEGELVFTMTDESVESAGVIPGADDILAAADSATEAAGTATEKATEASGFADTAVDAAANADTAADLATDAQAGAESARDTLLAQKAQPSGLAPLDGSSRVPQANLPTHLDPIQLLASFAAQLTTVSKTANYTAGAQEFVEVDASGGVVTITGPAAGVAKRWGVKKVNGTSRTAGNKVTVSYLNSAGVATSTDLNLAGESKIFRPAGSGYRIESGDTPRAALDYAYLPLNPNALVANLPNPFTIAHRAGPFLAPEESMSAYKISAAFGVHALEIDVQMLADGSLVAMHDTTVDRTCTTTGTVSKQTAGSWSKLLLNSATLMGETGWPAEGPPFVEQILRAYGNKVCIVPQPYDAATVTALDALIVSMGIDKRTILMQSFDTAGELAVARTLGYPTMKLYGSGAAPDAAAINALAALGTTHVCVNMDSMTSTVAANCVAAGIRPSVFSPTWRAQRDKLTAMGVQGWFTDNPAWMQGMNVAKPATDTFASQSYSPQVFTCQGNRAGFATPNKLHLVTGSVQCMHVMECPTGVDPDNCVITFDVTVTADGASTTNAWYMYVGQQDFMTPDARPTQDGITLDNCDGYRFAQVTDSGSSTTLRSVLWSNNGNAGNILTNGAGTYALNTKKSYKLTITPTTLKWEQVGTAGATTLNRSEYRNLRHLFFAKAQNVTVDFENVLWA